MESEERAEDTLGHMSMDQLKAFLKKHKVSFGGNSGEKRLRKLATELANALAAQRKKADTDAESARDAALMPQAASEDEDDHVYDEASASASVSHREKRPRPSSDGEQAHDLEDLKELTIIADSLRTGELEWGAHLEGRIADLYRHLAQRRHRLQAMKLCAIIYCAKAMQLAQMESIFVLSDEVLPDEADRAEFVAAIKLQFGYIWSFKAQGPLAQVVNKGVSGAPYSNPEVELACMNSNPEVELACMSALQKYFASPTGFDFGRERAAAAEDTLEPASVTKKARVWKKYPHKDWRKFMRGLSAWLGMRNKIDQDQLKVDDLSDLKALWSAYWGGEALDKPCPWKEEDFEEVQGDVTDRLGQARAKFYKSARTVLRQLHPRLPEETLKTTRDATAQAAFDNERDKSLPPPTEAGLLRVLRQLRHEKSEWCDHQFAHTLLVYLRAYEGMALTTTKKGETADVLNTAKGRTTKLLDLLALVRKVSQYFFAIYFLTSKL